MLTKMVTPVGQRAGIGCHAADVVVQRRTDGGELLLDRVESCCGVHVSPVVISYSEENPGAKAEFPADPHLAEGRKGCANFIFRKAGAARKRPKSVKQQPAPSATASQEKMNHLPRGQSISLAKCANSGQNVRTRPPADEPSLRGLIV